MNVQGQDQVPALQSCPDYVRKNCMTFVVFGTENSARIIDVSIRRGFDFTSKK